MRPIYLAKMKRFIALDVIKGVRKWLLSYGLGDG